MGCATCSSDKTGKVTGCGHSGGCSTGGCNRMNVFDWFSGIPLSFNEQYNVVEVSFKKGMRKGFYRNTNSLDLARGQLVVVETATGYDVGEVSMQGELVKHQMRKKRVSERDDTIRSILRIANETDVNLYLDLRNRERDSMIRARAIAKTMGVEMKVGDVEYQGDGKKITIYYIADGRVDFRELVKVYAREFKVKIEMRQIGARQEAARIGGIGSCGRELCCSTWLSDFKSVTTGNIRYQQLSLNTDKMSGQCGRLKCCLNYELDTYNDATKKFPRNADKIETEAGTAILRKTEILKGILVYEYEGTHGNPMRLSIDAVKELLLMNRSGKKPQSLQNFAEAVEVKDESKHDDLVGQVSLKTLEKKSRKRNRGRGGKNKPDPSRTPQPLQQKQNNPAQKPGQQTQHRKNKPPRHKGNRPPQQKPPQDGN